jgi:4-hydroxybenzoate polyprenyltransferase
MLHMRILFRLIRPSQWIKNFFVLAPLIFSKHLFEVRFVMDAIIGFIAFCFISSSVYILNDIYDKEMDKIHPLKRFRPIAAGEIGVRTSIFYAFLSLLAGMVISLMLPFAFVAILGFYFTIQYLYSVKLKNIVLLDVFIIASGFMLRVIAGAEAIGVALSSWIILCTMFLSLFLAVSKRRGELVNAQQTYFFKQRKVLADYTIPLLDQFLVITATGMALTYALYTVAQRTVNLFATENLIFTTIFVLFGIFRYLYLVMNKNMGENPVSIVTKDIPLLLNILFWLVSCIVTIYL